jgi:hypothetical protein
LQFIFFSVIFSLVQRVESFLGEQHVAATDKFTCDGCQREMTWKKEFAGRRIKCKNCGQPMVIPDRPNQPEPEPVGDDDLYALSDMVADAKQAVADLPPTVVEAAAMAIPAAVPAGGPPVGKPKASKSGIPLAYQRQMTAGEKERIASAGHVDKNREVYAPLILILVGSAFYIGYYAIHYHLGIFGIVSTGIGLAIMTAFETAILFGFALALAGPLGVSFGGIGTALLKFASISCLCDGVTTWINALIFGPGFMSNGIVGYGAVSFSIALGIYWVLLTYLFAMDPGDSWMVVCIIAFLAFVLRMVLVLVLLNFILSFGGIASHAPNLAGAGGGGSNSSAEMIDEVAHAKELNELHEAKKYAADFGRRAEAPFVDDWYKANAKNVWFQCDAGSNAAYRIVVELPDDAPSRTKCYDTAKKYYTTYGGGYDPQEMKDVGDPYIMVSLP